MREEGARRGRERKKKTGFSRARGVHRELPLDPGWRYMLKADIHINVSVHTVVVCALFSPLIRTRAKLLKGASFF